MRRRSSGSLSAARTAAIVAQLGKRVLSLHLKDVAKGTAVYYKGGVPRARSKKR
jgi:hypothetical protein